MSLPFKREYRDVIRVQGFFGVDQMEAQIGHLKPKGVLIGIYRIDCFRFRAYCRSIRLSAYMAQGLALMDSGLPATGYGSAKNGFLCQLLAAALMAVRSPTIF